MIRQVRIDMTLQTMAGLLHDGDEQRRSTEGPRW
jgi:hypothetical protein